jgi:hypothetical protein
MAYGAVQSVYCHLRREGACLEAFLTPLRDLESSCMSEQSGDLLADTDFRDVHCAICRRDAVDPKTERLHQNLFCITNCCHILCKTCLYAGHSTPPTQCPKCHQRPLAHVPLSHSVSLPRRAPSIEERPTAARSAAALLPPPRAATGRPARRRQPSDQQPEGGHAVPQADVLEAAGHALAGAGRARRCQGDCAVRSVLPDGLCEGCANRELEYLRAENARLKAELAARGSKNRRLDDLQAEDANTLGQKRKIRSSAGHGLQGCVRPG